MYDGKTTGVSGKLGPSAPAALHQLQAVVMGFKRKKLDEDEYD
jgi:hypothetical protein